MFNDLAVIKNTKKEQSLRAKGWGKVKAINSVTKLTEPVCVLLS